MRKWKRVDTADGPRFRSALAAHEATGAGVWAAASAGRLPGLADLVPKWIETVIVLGYRFID